jgi:hypothetical protein
LKRQDDGRYVVLNREYKPIGFVTTEQINYGDFPIAVKLPGLTASVARTLWHDGSAAVDEIFLYNDGCIPTASSAHMQTYLQRLAVFTKLKVL